MKVHTKLAAKAASFAHLLGLPAKGARAEDDDDDKKQRPDESDEDYAKRMEEDKKDEAKAEDDAESEDDETAEDDDEQDDKKARRAEDGEDDESMRAARMSERKRCKAIFASEAAGTRPDLAAHLAFETDMSSKDAVALLTAAAAGGTRGRSLADRMHGVTVAKVGADTAERPNPGDPKAIAARIVEAARKARGEK